MREIWKPCPDNHYLISSHGRVYAHDRLVRAVSVRGREYYRTRRGRIIKGHKDPAGYQRTEWRGIPYLIHRLVAEVFIPNPDELETVNHMDGDKQNNRVDNLEWASNSDNVIHAHINGLCDNRKPIRCLDTGESFESLDAACKRYGLAKGNLSSTLKGKQKTWAGLRWEYAWPTK